MRVIEEKRKDLERKEKKTGEYKKYVYTCPNCGSVLEVDRDDIRCEAYYTDIEHYISCPVCKEDFDVSWIGIWLHSKRFWDFFHPGRHEANQIPG